MLRSVAAGMLRMLRRACFPAVRSCTVVYVHSQVPAIHLLLPWGAGVLGCIAFGLNLKQPARACRRPSPLPCLMPQEPGVCR